MKKLPTHIEITLEFAAGNFVAPTASQLLGLAGLSAQAMVCEWDDFIMVYDPNADEGLCLQVITCDMDVYYMDVQSQLWVKI